jgi:hypothetical protein
VISLYRFKEYNENEKSKMNESEQTTWTGNRCLKCYNNRESWSYQQIIFQLGFQFTRSGGNIAKYNQTYLLDLSPYCTVLYH